MTDLFQCVSMTELFYDKTDIAIYETTLSYLRFDKKKANCEKRGVK